MLHKSRSTPNVSKFNFIFYPSFIRPQCSFMGMVISHDMLLGRWRLSLELFGRVFMEDVGAEPGSVCSF